VFFAHELQSRSEVQKRALIPLDLPERIGGRKMVEWLFMIRELERDRGPPIQSFENMTSLTILGPSCSLLSEARAVSSSPTMAGGGAVENVTGCPRPCYDEGEKGLVWHCRFHPTKPKLACALDKGRVCVFYARSPSMPFSEWEKLLFYTESSSLVLSIDWNVSILIILD
jgi:hypothetical protein